MKKQQKIFTGFDLIIDSTGFHRHYLPKLSDELWIPCIRYKVKYDPNAHLMIFYLKAFSIVIRLLLVKLSLGNGYVTYRIGRL
ncbi:MAG: hypothetical protein P0116_13680 [Candidatus Nitrosocosmicus sp.]|nr:hypothetical protein [Candidatus Nitrosocosmicus sp.]